MAYVGETPWHGLGNQLTQNQPIEVWAQQAGMDWRIESSDVSYMAKNDRGQSIIMPYEEQWVLYRSDRGKSTTQSYRTPVYYVDLTLRDGAHLQDAIQIAKEIDQQSKVPGFNQDALDQMARQGYGNARFEVNSEERLDLVEEFYSDEPKPEQHYQKHDLTHVQDMQKGLQQSVQALN